MLSGPHFPDTISKRSSAVWLKVHKSSSSQITSEILCDSTMPYKTGDNYTLDNSEDWVSHVVGSSSQKGNWKKYWQDHTNRSFGTCQTLGCSDPATVGAHVYIKGLHQNFILPTCQGCNMNPTYAYTGRPENFVKTKANAVAVWLPRDNNTYE